MHVPEGTTPKQWVNLWLPHHRSGCIFRDSAKGWNEWVAVILSFSPPEFRHMMKWMGAE